MGAAFAVPGLCLRVAAHSGAWLTFAGFHRFYFHPHALQVAAQSHVHIGQGAVFIVYGAGTQGRVRQGDMLSVPGKAFPGCGFASR